MICEITPKRIFFHIPGEPKGKGRPRVVNRGGFSKAFTPKETVEYENLVKLEYQRQVGNFRFPDDAMLDMRIIACFSIPKSDSKKKQFAKMAGEIRPTKKPDMDNIVKIIADSLNGIAYHDDAQIVDVQCRKFYSSTPGVEVKIIEVKE